MFALLTVAFALLALMGNGLGKFMWWISLIVTIVLFAIGRRRTGAHRSNSRKGGVG